MGEEQEWERIENMNVTLEDVARAETDDVDALKQACGKGQLRGKGIGCFITYNGSTTFKQGTRAECLAAKKPKQGATLYIVLTIQFPDSIPADSISTLRGILPPPLNTVTAEEGAENVDVVQIEDRDPVESYNYNKPKVADEDDDEGHGHGMQGGNVQCAQQ